MSQSPYVCPHCQSDNVMKKSVVYEQGAYTSESKGSGIGIGLNGSVSVITGSGTTTNVTALAAKCAPPAKPNIINKFNGLIFFSLGMAISWLRLNTILSWVLFGGIVFFMVKNHMKKEAIWQQEMAEWNKDYVCLRCGTSYKVE